MYELKCPCGQHKRYDGTADGVFVLGPTRAVALEHLYMGLEMLHVCAMPPESFHAVLVDQLHGDFHVGPQHPIRLFSPNTWRTFFFVFLHCINKGLQQTEPSPQLPSQADLDFKCVVCGTQPRVLIVDGTSVTMNKDYFTGVSMTEPHSELATVMRHHTRNQRSFFDESEARRREKLMNETKLFASKLMVKRQELDIANLDIDFVPPPSHQPQQQLYETLRQRGIQYGIVDVMRWIYANVSSTALTDGNRKALGIFLGNNLATDSPVLAYLPRRVAIPIQFDLEHNSWVLQVETVKAVAQFAPLLFNVLGAAGACRTLPFTVPNAFKILLSVLCERSRRCVEGPGMQDSMNLNERSIPSSASTQCLQTGICCGLPQLRNRPRFEADNVQADNGTEEDGGCHKNFQWGGARTGGVMTVFCEHEVCYASFVMEGSESRDHLFSFMVKYLERPPEVLVYDFGCAVLDYCLNRLPDWFKDTLVVVDRFHWSNHKACCSSFNMRVYQDVEMVNSQVAEQCNAALRRINPTLHKSSQPFFMAILRQYLRGWNAKKNKKSTANLETIRRYTV